MPSMLVRQSMSESPERNEIIHQKQLVKIDHEAIIENEDQSF